MVLFDFGEGPTSRKERDKWGTRVYLFFLESFFELCEVCFQLPLFSGTLVGGEELAA